ncbi:DUF397 domain-containing protein [Streptomyces sp. NPDC052109]|uniref:DUF397 domain-containing protein n=1 Tax=Streptomyces sp. NPDC052109 TaxID=3155527 RepID=UPI003412CD0C
MSIPTPDTWQSSSFSGGGQGDACVEVADLETHMAIRGSKAPARATLTFPPHLLHQSSEQQR